GIVPRPAWEWIGESMKQVGFSPPELWEEASALGWYQGCPADPGINVICRHREYVLALGLELGYDLQKELEYQSFDAVLADNSVYWRSYWDKVPRVSLPDEFMNKFYRLALYKFACATDPAGGIPASLQGPWLEEYQRSPWSCDYHFNVNIQQIYTLGFGTGAWENILPLFDMLESESFQSVMRSNAKNLFGIDDGLLLTHAVDDRGFQCCGISVGAVLDFACGGWVGKLYWDYYRHTLDKEFLRKRAFPFITGVMRIYEAALEERKDESLSLPLSISAEYGHAFPVKKDGKLCRQNSGRNPSNQLMCAHMLSEILIEASTILELEPKQEWLNVRERLPLYCEGGESGNERIILWEGQDLDVCHRHHSHLAGIYPFENLSEPTKEQARVIDNTIDHWILLGMGQWSEWCYPWAAIIQARLGFTEAPAQLLNLWKELFVNESMSTVYLPRFRGLSAHRRADMLKPKESHEIMQLDGTMAGATAIQEMLVHRKMDTIYVFPGIPEKWQDVSFENIRLPGGICVSAVRNHGRTVNVQIKSVGDGSIKIKLPENISPITVDLEAGKEKNIDGTAD
ncbi:MAG: hypothetical protein JXR78_01555, partial [Victivallales bacterium]|nr:hypothetical protein [Victivallales bacterium]